MADPPPDNRRRVQVIIPGKLKTERKRSFAVKKRAMRVDTPDRKEWKQKAA